MNAELNRKGMHVKAQTVCNNSNFTWTRSLKSNWSCLSFSLTQGEGDQLRSEPVILNGMNAPMTIFKRSMDRTV